MALVARGWRRGHAGTGSWYGWACLDRDRRDYIRGGRPTGAIRSSRWRLAFRSARPCAASAFFAASPDARRSTARTGMPFGQLGGAREARTSGATRGSPRSCVCAGRGHVLHDSDGASFVQGVRPVGPRDAERPPARARLPSRRVLRAAVRRAPQRRSRKDVPRVLCRPPARALSGARRLPEMKRAALS
jgi:hypothetical protein